MTVRTAVTAAVTGTVALHVYRARRAAGRQTADAPTVTVDDGVQLHVEVDGPADAPLTVVLAHGFAARSAMYDPQWAALRGSVRLVRFDQRGHGRSGWAGSLSATPRRLGRDLGRVVDALAAPGPVVLVGHSMGGMAVLALARERPQLFGTRVAGVALLSTVDGPLAAAGRHLTGPALRLRTALGAVGAWLLWLAAPLVHAMRPFLSRPGQRLVRCRLFTTDPPGDAVREMTDAWIRTPTGVMSALLLGLGPEARLVLVPGAGHMVTLTHADAVTAALMDLLARVRARHEDRRAS